MRGIVGDGRQTARNGFDERTATVQSDPPGEIRREIGRRRALLWRGGRGRRSPHDAGKDDSCEDPLPTSDRGHGCSLFFAFDACDGSIPDVAPPKLYPTSPVAPSRYHDEDC